MNSNKDNVLIEDAEYGLDSLYNSDKEYESEATLLMEARLKRMKNLSKDQIIRAKLMQLKLRMEEYLKEPIYDNQNHFSDFLKVYVDTIYSTRSMFAKDINITPIRLSQVINNHREPKEEFIMKLMIHSDKVYQNICDFQMETWYQVYFHEKICDTMSSQDKWKPKLAKDIKLSESLK
ncbi:hypothetical protein [uncultured Algoriphagus sp.]|uniref:hypothetical protein n=1 Tax=uncultured Algoriphagus sp. TaxID=417365 RepID=UPI0030ECCAC6|tara:strand:+ start:57580 stop:58113 length:534 start_codon:yes stop_codon:yes gene_type:complete